MTVTREAIADDAGVHAAVGAARASGRAALDLEFLWERTYAPQACLAQLAVEDVYLIDPVVGAPLEPVAALVADPEVEVVMHAPSSDLQLLGMAFGTRPSRLGDVQVAAGFVGLGAGQSLAALLDRVLGVRLDKGERYTDWSRRPLSEGQLEYAVADVAHLLALHDRLTEQIRARGRDDWLAEELGRRYGPDARLTPDAATAWRRVKGQGRLAPRERATLAALARWREQRAAARDRPVGWIIPDRTLIELARRKPSSRRALMAERGVPDRLGGADADALLATIRDAEDDEPIRLAPPPPRPVQEQLDLLVPMGALLVAGRAQAAEVAPSLVATRDEIAAFLQATIADTDEEGPLRGGWRAELVGDALRDLAAGRVALAANGTRPYLREVPLRSPDAVSNGGGPAG